jgi:hypothetical protein
LEDVLGVQFKVTLWGTGACTGVAVKFTPQTGAPLTVTETVGGVNVYPDWLAATTYVPFARTESVYFPVESVVADAVAAPERANVAADPLTIPEIVDDGAGLDVPGANTRSTQ